MILMPGKSFKGQLPPMTDAQIKLKDDLRRHVDKMASEIGERNFFNYQQLNACVRYIEDQLASYGYKVAKPSYDIDGKEFFNLEAQLDGTARPQEIIVIGAHYDTVYGCPGANDNTSGVAGVLAAAKYFAAKKTNRTVRFVFFPNEEPPFFQTEKMGSFVYARQCRQRSDNIIAMLAFETIGHYSDAPGSQKYPFPFSLFYPSTGDFIGFVSNLGSKSLLKKTVGLFRQNCRFPSQAGAVPEAVPGAGWSDHWSFWKFDYPALMVTDTAPFRYRHYHTPEDTADKLDYDRMARVVSGLFTVIEKLDAEK